MGVGNEQRIDEVVFLHRGRLLATSAALLRTVIGNRLVFDVAGVGHRHHNFFGRDQIFHRHFLRIGDDFGTSLIAKLLLHVV